MQRSMYLSHIEQGLADVARVNHHVVLLAKPQDVTVRHLNH